jgi:hypothetical protein
VELVKVNQPAMGVCVGTVGVAVNIEVGVAVGGRTVGVRVASRIVRADPLEGRVVSVLFP